MKSWIVLLGLFCSVIRVQAAISYSCDTPQARENIRRVVIEKYLQTPYAIIPDRTFKPQLWANHLAKFGELYLCLIANESQEIVYNKDPRLQRVVQYYQSKGENTESLPSIVSFPFLKKPQAFSSGSLLVLARHMIAEYSPISFFIRDQVSAFDPGAYEFLKMDSFILEERVGPNRIPLFLNWVLKTFLGSSSVIFIDSDFWSNPHIPTIEKEITVAHEWKHELDFQHRPHFYKHGKNLFWQTMDGAWNWFWESDENENLPKYDHTEDIRVMIGQLMTKFFEIEESTVKHLSPGFSLPSSTDYEAFLHYYLPLNFGYAALPMETAAAEEEIKFLKSLALNCEQIIEVYRKASLVPTKLAYAPISIPMPFIEGYSWPSRKICESMK